MPSDSQYLGWPNQQEGDFLIRDFRFGSGETLPELNMHYTTIGAPKRDGSGDITNAVLLIHTTSGGGMNWLTPLMAGELFGDGQPLDASRFFLIIPDSIGFGGSSKPSDGLRTKFPHYRYKDSVNTQYQLVTRGLGVTHLHAIIGLSMGGMHAWLWGVMYPGFMDGLVPIASQPTAMSGRNWIIRRTGIEAIRRDPEWNGGYYERNPSTYVYLMPLVGSMLQSPVRLQETAPSLEETDALYLRAVEQAKHGDANDHLYVLESVMGYDPSDELENIKARVLAINFEDDAINPPELGVVEPAIARIPDARFVLIPADDETCGHATNLRANKWKSHLGDFLMELETAIDPA